MESLIGSTRLPEKQRSLNMIEIQHLRKMMKANEDEYNSLPANQRREQGARNGWKGYTRGTTRHTQSYSKARKELQQERGPR